MKLNTSKMSPNVGEEIVDERNVQIASQLHRAVDQSPYRTSHWPGGPLNPITNWPSVVASSIVQPPLMTSEPAKCLANSATVHNTGALMVSVPPSVASGPMTKFGGLIT